MIGLIENGVQSFTYRGARLITPAGDVFVIHPGEAHTGEAVSPGGYTYRTLYPPVALLQRASSDIVGGEQGMPLTRRFTRLLGVTPGQYLRSKMVQNTQAAHRVP